LFLAVVSRARFHIGAVIASYAIDWVDGGVLFRFGTAVSGKETGRK